MVAIRGQHECIGGNHCAVCGYPVLGNVCGECTRKQQEAKAKRDREARERRQANKQRKAAQRQAEDAKRRQQAAKRAPTRPAKPVRKPPKTKPTHRQTSSGSKQAIKAITVVAGIALPIATYLFAQSNEVEPGVGAVLALISIAFAKPLAILIWYAFVFAVWAAVIGGGLWIAAQLVGG